MSELLVFVVSCLLVSSFLQRKRMDKLEAKLDKARGERCA